MISELLSPRGNYNRYSPKNVSPSYAKSIICYINGKPSNYGNSGISIDLHSTSTSMYHLLQAAGKRLQIQAKRVFNVEGRELDEVSMIGQGDALFFSEGENFVRPSRVRNDIDNNGNEKRQKQRSIYNNYELLKQLGAGSFGMVFYTKHILTHKEAALKFIQKSYTSKFTETVFSEIHCLERLKHNNIINLDSVINAKDHMILVMEYAKGGDLKNYIKERKAVNEEVICKIFNQIVDAIRYCHKQRILHHDLKLQNILLMEKISPPENESDELANMNYIDNICVKIADFGLSTTFNDDNSFKGGSLAYLSPEVLNKSKDCDSTARDIWAIGIILFALCTGHLPWGRGTNDDVKRKILKYDGTRRHFSEILDKIKKKQAKRRQSHIIALEKLKIVDGISTTSSSNSSPSTNVADDVDNHGNDSGEGKNTKKMEPPILMNDEIRDLSCKILRPSWNERATIATISNHTWLFKFDKHTRATIKSPKRSSPPSPFFRRITSPKSAKSEVGDKGFKPSNNHNNNNDNNNDNNHKKKTSNSNYVITTSMDKKYTCEKPIAENSKLAFRRSMKIPTITTKKRASPYKIMSPRSGSIMTNSESSTGDSKNEGSMRKNKSMPDLFNYKKG